MLWPYMPMSNEDQRAVATSKRATLFGPPSNTHQSPFAAISTARGLALGSGMGSAAKDLLHRVQHVHCMAEHTGDDDGAARIDGDIVREVLRARHEILDHVRRSDNVRSARIRSRGRCRRTRQVSCEEGACRIGVPPRPHDREGCCSARELELRDVTVAHCSCDRGVPLG